MNRPCKACNKPLLFVETPEGKIIPLDVNSRKHIYEVSDSSVELIASRIDAREVYVSHFLVCPEASKFGKKATP